VKFTPAGGEIRISGNAIPGGTEIVVTDTGIGMAEADIPRALTVFGQLDNAYARRHDGSGLGLPLAKSLVELHGGTLTIDSAPGKGTRFTLRLPQEPTGASEGGISSRAGNV
jgi:signal transduction histidine kinase